MADIVLSQIANGLVLGFLFVLLAIGLSIICGLLGIVNFAHGALFALGAYFAVALSMRFGWWAVVLVPVLVAAVGVLIEVIFIRRLYGKETLQGLIVTFALSLLLTELIRLIWGAGGLAFSPPEALSGVFVYGPLLLTKYRLFVLVTTIVILVALWWFMKFTPYGRILRAGSRDSEMVGLLGINLPRVLTGAFGLGALLAGAAGLLAAPLLTVTPSMATTAVMPAFVIVTIGGLGSFAGAVVAGLLVGVVTALAVQFFPEGSSVAMYVLMALVLLVRPRGLFGERWERFE
ncbi:branched-chain amino acid ABC transporter permease [Paraburkholderia panacisoli]|uniref:Branched-chain amino acid ABC transporter permease n=1 Tax=Paraburkholderia panacisoli TaxID=2603818 RepID=A0A5B0GKR4_9BURK|nr:branched-chain amino acid ABC transporter permease [Paraburkholderia panacisoli]KAA1004044.1 branched-chain amino acid ABC transporter permease [Paraburkholderia panacisoli]